MAGGHSKAPHVCLKFQQFAGAFTINVVAEGRNGFKHIQILSGCPRLAYWAGSFVWDFAIHCTLCLACVALFALVGNQVELLAQSSP